MHRGWVRSSRKCKIFVILAIWIGANLAALALIDIYESEVQKPEFHVSASVLNSYASRTAVVPLEHSQQPVSLSYRFLPPNSSAETRAVPLVVFLHGGGECGTENEQQLRDLPSILCQETMRKLHPCAVLAPQCPQPEGWLEQLDEQ